MEYADEMVLVKKDEDSMLFYNEKLNAFVKAGGASTYKSRKTVGNAARKAFRLDADLRELRVYCLNGIGRHLMAVLVPDSEREGN